MGNRHQYSSNKTATITVLYLALLPVFTSAIAEDSQQLQKSHPSKSSEKPERIAPSSRKMVEKHTDDLRLAMLSLYRLNPQELQKSASVSPEEMVQWVFEGPFGWKFDALREAQGISALEMAFSLDFHGDRILALITGMQTMIISAYGGKTEFLFSEPADPQRLYISARNTDIVRWKLIQANSGLRIEGPEIQEIESILISIKQRLESDAKAHARKSAQALIPAPSTIESAAFLPF
ncbi:MAG: hypothetical protein CVU35_00730 [Betaproteobacteria bacterium HGW-Betaproteobacteria-8]|nr:MAG: hypothetical protein CVU35_00730 [Betaproteobacteria bacterium HGW-Betaproteobacteria-8]